MAFIYTKNVQVVLRVSLFILNHPINIMDTNRAARK
jgi:hypothetical protein